MSSTYRRSRLPVVEWPEGVVCLPERLPLLLGGDDVVPAGFVPGVRRLCLAHCSSSCSTRLCTCRCGRSSSLSGSNTASTELEIRPWKLWSPAAVLRTDVNHGLARFGPMVRNIVVGTLPWSLPTCRSLVGVQLG